MRLCPAEGVLRHPGNDWLGRGPSDRKGHLWLHGGLDIFNRGKPVVSPEAGRVIYSIKEIPKEKSIFGGYGPSVVCVHGESDVYHWLAHVKNPVVTRNQYVEAGEVVAMATTDHVHWELRQVLIPYKGTRYWPWTVTIDPYRWLFKSVLTGMDAIHYCKNHLPGDDWKDPKKRMALLRATKQADVGKNPYPIRLSWTRDLKRNVVIQTRQKIIMMRPQVQPADIAIGVFAGLSIFAAVLL
jgi:hypothetical protein